MSSGEQFHSLRYDISMSASNAVRGGPSNLFSDSKHCISLCLKPGVDTIATRPTNEVTTLPGRIAELSREIVANMKDSDGGTTVPKIVEAGGKSNNKSLSDGDPDAKNSNRRRNPF